MIKIAFSLPKGMPKLSGLTTPLRTPELQFEKMVFGNLEIELPKGPLSMLLNFQRSFEVGETPEFPEAPTVPNLEGLLAKFPKLLPIPAFPGVAEGAPGVTERPPPTEEPKRRRVSIGQAKGF